MFEYLTRPRFQRPVAPDTLARFFSQPQSNLSEKR